MYKLNISRILFIGLVLISLLPTAWAMGLAVAPSKFEFHNAMRGGEYERVLAISNPGRDAGNFSLSVVGDADGWIYFYPLEEPTNSITNIGIPGREVARVLVKFRIPKDTSAGNYLSTIYVQGIPGGDEEVKPAVALRMPIKVIFEVTSTQTLTGVVKSIAAMDVEKNYPLRIKVDFKNTGNVIAKPEIKVDVIKDEEIVNSFVYSNATVKPSSRDIIPVEWNTHEMQSGDYVVDVSVFLGGELVDKKELAFKLLPIGTLTRKGSLIDLSYTGELMVGRLIKILSIFRNTGEIDTKAKFVGEVYRDGNLVDALDSDELLIPVREKDTLTTYLKIEAPGEYTINGHILYGGKKTDTRELSFIVPEAGATTSTIQFTSTTTIKEKTTIEGGTQPGSIPWMAIIIVLLLIIAILVLTVRRKGKK